MNFDIGSPKNRLSMIRDGAATTLMLSENIHRTYDWEIQGMPPYFSWLAGDFFGKTYFRWSEQAFGMVWVVSENPQPGTTPANLDEQEGINRNSHERTRFLAFWPQFARPASNHGSGVNVAFRDGHTQFLRDDIEYTVYQRLMTSNGAKCVDPRNWENLTASGETISNFRALPPLSNDDYQ